MNRTKTIRLITIFTLGLAAIIVFGFAFAALRTPAVAAEYYAPSVIFENGEGGTVGTDKPEEGAEEGATYRVQFTLGDGGRVHFRRNLALKWFAAAPADDTAPAGTLVNPGVPQYLSMQFAFPEVLFETFTVSFDSAEENVTKEGLTTNALVFTKTASGFDVCVHDSDYDEEDTENVPAATSFDYTAGTVISFRIDDADCEPGSFSVYLKVGSGEEKNIGEFTNISGYYLEYRSPDSTTPSTPITFEADLPDTAEESATQRVLMHELNGQTFEVGEDGRVEDNAPPVLVLNETIYPIRLGQSFSLTYYVIDVMRSASVSSRSYYMFDSEDPHAPNEESSDVEAEKQYNYKSLSSTAYFLPPNDESLTDDGTHVAIRFTLTDSTFTKTYVYLTWYADKDAVTTEGSGENAYDYIKVLPEIDGPVYSVLTANSDAKTNDKGADYDTTIGKYQEELDAAAEKVSAGDGAYLYLPSLRELITSDYADYRNLRFNIYYYKPNTADGGSATSATSLRYSNLRIEVDREGTYKMRIVATDSASNEMKYYDTDGNLVALTSSNVWDIENIPDFYFTIKYTGPSIEDAGTQTEGRRDQTYSISQFDIIALDGYETEYHLFYFSQERFDSLTEDVLGGLKIPAAYSDLAKDIDGIAKRLQEIDEDRDEKILREIRTYNDEVSESDEEWDETDNAYHWNPSSVLSFCPQEEGYYFLKVTVTDSKIKGGKGIAEKWMAINVYSPQDRKPGQSKWLQNNTTAVVLFAIAGALLIAIILLAVIRPSDKKVEEVDLKSLKGGKKKDKGNKKE